MTIVARRNAITFNDAMLDVESDDVDSNSDNDIKSIFRWDLINGEDTEEGRAVLAERVVSMIETVEDSKMHAKLMDDLAVYMRINYKR